MGRARVCICPICLYKLYKGVFCALSRVRHKRPFYVHPSPSQSILRPFHSELFSDSYGHFHSFDSNSVQFVKFCNTFSISLFNFVHFCSMMPSNPNLPGMDPFSWPFSASSSPSSGPSVAICTHQNPSLPCRFA